MANIGYALLAAFLTSVLAVSFFIKFAPSIGLVSKRNFRRQELSKIPLLGGLGIYLSFFVVSIAFYGPSQVSNFFWISLPILVVGIADDALEFSAKIKFSAQLTAISIWCFLTPPTSLLSQVGLPIIAVNIFATIWILGVMNATNMIDGLDGIASTFAIITCVAAGFLPGHIDSTNLWIMGFAYFGFFIFNFAPAKIYLGDLGSQLIGLFLAIQLLDWKPEPFSKFDLFIPLLMFAFPQIDAVLAITRRLLAGQSPFHADKEHLHHKILRSLESVRQTWTLISLIVGVCACVAWIIATSNDSVIKYGVLASTVTSLSIILWWTLKTESIMTKRVALDGKFLMTDHFQLEGDVVLYSDLESVVIYDLRPYYQDLQAHGLEKLDHFIKRFSEYIKTTHEGSATYLINYHSVVVTEKRLAISLIFKTNLTQNFFALTREFKIQKNEGLEPLGVKFFSVSGFEEYAKKNRISYSVQPSQSEMDKVAS